MELELIAYLFYLLPFIGFIGSGSGTDADPYIVTNMDELNDVRNELDAVYEQANDIDAGAETDNSGGDYWNGGDGWEPIGTFTGEYRGAGFKIDGLFISRTLFDNMALFSFEDGAIISELGMTNVDITGDTHLGALVGDSVASSTGTIDRCYATGSITSDQADNAFTGGLCGEYDGTISDCWTDVDITQSQNDDHVGGLVGQLVGTVNRCFAVGSITAEDSIRTGGLIGRNFGTVNDSFWDTETTGESDSDGGTGKTTAEMQDVATFTDTTTTGLTNPWDFVGNPNDDVATDDWWDIDTGYPFLTAFVSGTTNFDGDVSISHTLGLSPSASAAVTGGVTNTQTMGMSDQGGATTLASLEQAITLALATSGAISFEGNITVNVTYGQDTSATAQTSAELSGAENVTLFHAYAMSTSAVSSASGDTTIDLSYDQSVAGAVGINNFDASVALGALTYQTSITGTALTVADATQAIQYALDSIAAAASSSDVTIDIINDISVAGNVITVDVTLSDGRTLSVSQQNRTLSIDTENRTLTIKP